MACWIAPESSARPSALPLTVTARESGGADSNSDLAAKAVVQVATVVNATMDSRNLRIYQRAPWVAGVAVAPGVSGFEALVAPWVVRALGVVNAPAVGGAL